MYMPFAYGATAERTLDTPPPPFRSPQGTHPFGRSPTAAAVALAAPAAPAPTEMPFHPQLMGVASPPRRPPIGVASPQTAAAAEAVSITPDQSNSYFRVATAATLPPLEYNDIEGLAARAEQSFGFLPPLEGELMDMQDLRARLEHHLDHNDLSRETEAPDVLRPVVVQLTPQFASCVFLLGPNGEFFCARSPELARALVADYGCKVIECVHVSDLNNIPLTRTDTIRHPPRRRNDDVGLDGHGFGDDDGLDDFDDDDERRKRRRMAAATPMPTTTLAPVSVTARAATPPVTEAPQPTVMVPTVEPPAVPAVAVVVVPEELPRGAISGVSAAQRVCQIWEEGSSCNDTGHFSAARFWTSAMAGKKKKPRWKNGAFTKLAYAYIAARKMNVCENPAADDRTLTTLYNDGNKFDRRVWGGVPLQGKLPQWTDVATAIARDRTQVT